MGGVENVITRGSYRNKQLFCKLLLQYHFEQILAEQMWNEGQRGKSVELIYQGISLVHVDKITDEIKKKNLDKYSYLIKMGWT